VVASIMNSSQNAMPAVSRAVIEMSKLAQDVRLRNRPVIHRRSVRHADAIMDQMMVTRFID